MTNRALKFTALYHAAIWVIFNVKSPWSFLKAYFIPYWQTIHLKNNWTLKVRGSQTLRYLYAIFGKKIYGAFKGTEKTVIDIGANIGLYSIYSAINTNDSCRIFAFEPSPETYNVLAENIGKNNLAKKITPIKKAVTGKSTVLQMSLPDNPFCHNLYGFQNSPTKVDVQTTSLTEIIRENKIDFIDVLKLNCEGAEYDILLNLPEVVLDKIGEIRMEYHQTTINGTRVEVQQIIDHLCKKGFNINKYQPMHPKHGILWFSRS